MAKLEDQVGEYQKAMVILEGLIKTDPDWLDPHWVLAQVYSRRCRPSRRMAKRESDAQIDALRSTREPKGNLVPCDVCELQIAELNSIKREGVALSHPFWLVLFLN